MLDLSREKIDEDVLKEFQTLFATHIESKIQQMFQGKVINKTEKREVLHFLMRSKVPYPELPENVQQIHKESREILERIKELSNQVRSGHYLTPEGKKFESVISVGIGGSALGTQFVNEALKFNPKYSGRTDNLKLYFISNVDPSSFVQVSSSLDPRKTLVVLVSKSFTTAETLQNGKLVKNWILKAYEGTNITKEKIIDSQFLAVSANIPLCKQFGINEKNVFPIWDQIGGRFSVSSAVGALPISLSYGYDVFDQFLEGMYSMDQIFFKEKDVRKNFPVLLSLLDSFHNFSQGFVTKIIIPYSEGLNKFPSHIQQVEMESIGKHYNVEKDTFLQSEEFVAQFVFGEPGTNS